MCDEGEAAAEEPAAEEKEGSIFDTISALPAELIEKIKGLTLLEAKDLIEDVDNAFGVGAAAGKDETTTRRSRCGCARVRAWSQTPRGFFWTITSLKNILCSA